MLYCIKCRAPLKPGHHCNRALLRLVHKARTTAAAAMLAILLAANGTPQANASGYAPVPVDVGAYSDPTDGHEAIYIPVPDCATVAYDAATHTITLNLDHCS